MPQRPLPAIFGRCIAPPMTDERLINFKQQIANMPASCAALVNTMHDLVSKHKAGQQITNLSNVELDNIGIMIEVLAEPQRTPAFHLLWYLKELSVGRTPAVQ